MTYKTILVHLDNGARRRDRLELGFELASRFDAHLVGLFAVPLPFVPSYAMVEMGAVVREIEDRHRAELSQAAEREFREMQRRRGGKAEWRLSRASPVEAMQVNARYADLVLLGQPEPNERDARAFVEEVMLSSGRPVLFVPYAGRFTDTGRRVLVAWNASSEAARSVTDALPLLRQAQTVEVVVFEPGGDHGEVPGADLSLWLARHGVKATAARQRAPDVEVGAQILSRAADMGADLIVMGGYGRSRLRELVLGGATRTVLDSMTVPVLMSH